MKLIRWILSNIILIAFVLALTYAYVYWDNLTGEDTPAGKAIAYLSEEFDEVREFLDEYDISVGGEAEETVAEAESTAVETVEQAAPTAAVQPSPQMQPLPMARTEPRTAMQQPPSRPMPSARTEPPQQAMPAPVRRPEPPAQAMRPFAPREPQPPVQREPAQAPATASSGDTAGTEVSTRELWIDARKEFHRGNIEASISNYKAVIAKSDNNFDAYGELGNVYLNSGNQKEAAAAYYEAAAILVKQGHKARAASLLRMLDRLDREKAKALRDLLSPPSRV